MNLSHKDFIAMCNEKPLNLDSVFSYYKDIINFYNYKNNQTEIYYISDTEHLIEPSMYSILDGFGICVNDLIGSRDKYILIIEPTLPLREQLVNQIENLPKAIPTHMVVNSDDPEVIKEIYGQVKRSYPSIELCQAILTEESEDDRYNNLVNKLKTDKLLNITDYCKRLFYMDNTLLSYLETFTEIVDEIAEKAKGKIIVFCGEEKYHQTYMYLTSELYLRYSSKFYIEDAYIAQQCLHIMRSLYDPDTHLFEETVRYVLEIPRVLINSSSFVENTIATYNVVKSKDIKIQMKFIEFESDNPNDMQEDTLSIHDIEVQSIYDWYDINSLEGCSLLKNKIMELYSTLKIDEWIIDVTRLVIFSKNSKLYIGVVQDFDIDIKVLSFSVIGTMERRLTKRDLFTYVPLDMFLNGRAMTKFILEKNGIEYSDKYIHPYKTNRKLTDVLYNSLLRVDQDWRNSPLDLDTLGLYSKYCRVQRAGFLKYFINAVGLDAMRAEVDCFGGFNPKIKRALVLGRV